MDPFHPNSRTFMPHQISSRFIAFKQHPQGKEIVSRVQRYFRSNYVWPASQNKQAYLKHDIENWSLMICPSAPEDRAELASLYATYFFIYDDLLEEMDVEEALKCTNRVLQILSRNNLPSNMTSLETIFNDICTRIETIGEATSHKLALRIFDKTRLYFEMAGSKGERANSLEMGLDEYLHYRVADIGFWFCMALIFWELQVAIPDYIWEDPYFNAVAEFAGAQEAFINDLFSYHKEQEQLSPQENPNSTALSGDGYVVYNAITIILRDEFPPFNVMDLAQKHLTIIEERLLNSMHMLRERCANLWKEDTGVVEQGIEALEVWLKGNAGWSMTCGRYNGDL